MNFIRKVSFPQSLVVLKTACKTITGLTSQVCNHINISLTLVFKTFKKTNCKGLLLGQMKEQSFVHSLLRREPYCCWHRSPWTVIIWNGSAELWQNKSVFWKLLSPHWVGSSEKWGCSSRAGNVPALFAPARLRAHSSYSVGLPVTSSLCPGGLVQGLAQ